MSAKIKVKAIQIELGEEVTVSVERMQTALDYFCGKIERHAHLDHRLDARLSTFSAEDLEAKEEEA